MAIKYSVDTAAGLIRTTCRGLVRLPDVLAHFDTLRRESGLPPRPKVLLDLRGLATPPMTPQLRTVTDHLGLQPELAFGDCAIVVDRDVLYGVARMFQVMAQPHFHEILIFRELEPAERWLAGSQPPTPSSTPP